MHVLVTEINPVALLPTEVEGIGRTIDLVRLKYRVVETGNCGEVFVPENAGIDTIESVIMRAVLGSAIDSRIEPGHTVVFD